MSVRQLIIGGVTVPVYAMTEISQRYEPLQASHDRRTADGTLITRTLWSGKLRTVISGSGLIPPGLADLDFDSNMTLSCVAHRAITQAGNVFTLPAARRTDSGSTPYGRAAVGDAWVSTPVDSLVSNTLTLTAVTGATAYQAVWFPELTVKARLVSEDHPEHGQAFGWSVEAEEI